MRESIEQLLGILKGYALAILAVAVVVLYFRQHYDRQYIVGVDNLARASANKLADIVAVYRCPDCKGVELFDCHVGRVTCQPCGKRREAIGWTFADPERLRGYNDGGSMRASFDQYSEGMPVSAIEFKSLRFRVSDLERQASEIKSELGI